MVGLPATHVQAFEKVATGRLHEFGERTPVLVSLAGDAAEAIASCA